MDIEEKIKYDYKKLKSLNIAKDIIAVINRSKTTCLEDMIDMLKRVCNEHELNSELKSNITLKIHKEIFGNVVVPYIKKTKKELGIE